jgi:phage tail sheath protein FI
VDKGTQWAVFENNNEPLWANIRRTVEDFLFNEWRSGALMGAKPEEAYFVRCDRSTMTQNDLDNGRLICLVGVAVVKPAEFVIFRIGQWTADRKV